MSKKKLGPMPLVWPHPAVLVGTVFDGRVDFATYAWTGIAASSPPCLTVGLQHPRHTLKGIYQSRVFSVNIPSVDLVKETDYCGLVSGAATDKVEVCGFHVFYGSLDKAPLIEECPINLECEMVHALDLGSHVLVVGKIVESHVSEDCLTADRPDISKIRPFAFGPGRYHVIGEAFADAFKIGNELKKGK